MRDYAKTSVRYHCKKCVYVFWVLFFVYIFWGLLEPAFTASELNLMMKNFGWPLSPDGLEVLWNDVWKFTCYRVICAFPIAYCWNYTCKVITDNYNGCLASQNDAPCLPITVPSQQQQPIFHHCFQRSSRGFEPVPVTVDACLCHSGYVEWWRAELSRCFFYSHSLCCILAAFLRYSCFRIISSLCDRPYINRCINTY